MKRRGLPYSFYETMNHLDHLDNCDECRGHLVDWRWPCAAIVFFALWVGTAIALIQARTEVVKNSLSAVEQRFLKGEK